MRIDAPCLDCNQPITVEMQDGRLLRVDPPEIVGHLNHPFPIRVEDRAFR